jgi:hypothetical protein
VKDYDRWFVLVSDAENGVEAEVREFDRAGQAADYIKSEIDMGRAKLEDFQVIYGREFDLKLTEVETTKVKRVEFV